MEVLSEILIFIIVLVVLILVHEVGHFIVAKLVGIRVDEFGIGFPPRALTIARIGETEYTLNWLPLGGFVRLYEEDGPDEGVQAHHQREQGGGGAAGAQRDPSHSFAAKPFVIKALVLLAGIAMNLIFAWIVFSVTLAIGTQQELMSEQQIQTTKDATIVFATVAPGSPADSAGFLPGDEITSEELVTKTYGESYTGGNPIAFTTLIAMDTIGAPIVFTVDRNGTILHLTATPKTHVIPRDPSRPGIGVEVVSVGTVKTPLKEVPLQGLLFTWAVTKETAIALGTFFKGVVTLSANLSEVAGPVGIANAVGQASLSGLSALLSLVALISVNLALVNLIPIPALDGGRLLFVIIEAVIRRPLNPKIAERVNQVGFALLLCLMFVITVHDIYTIIH